MTTISIPDIYLAGCTGFALGVLAIIGFAYITAYAQRAKRRRNR